MTDNNKETSANPLQEVERKVLITPEDVTGAADFWTHFEIPMPEELKASFDKFCKEPTLENQDSLKLALVRAVGHTDHEAFNDEMFKEIREECRSVDYDMSFDKKLEGTLGDSENKS